MGTKNLIEEQISRLGEHHFLILFWAMRAKDLKKAYNVTNVFDDLKSLSLTRTKQNAVSYIESLRVLSHIDLELKSNKKNIVITDFGLMVLQTLVEKEKFEMKNSTYLEEEE